MKLQDASLSAESRDVVNSFIQAISIAPLLSTTTQKRSRHSTDTVSEFHDEAPQATTSEGLAQGPYMAARARFEPTTHRTKGVDSTNEPPWFYINVVVSLTKVEMKIQINGYYKS